MAHMGGDISELSIRGFLRAQTSIGDKYWMCSVSLDHHRNWAARVLVFDKSLVMVELFTTHYRH